MASVALFKLKNIYNFTTLAPGVLGNTYSNMKVVGMMSHTEAIKYRDVLTLHETVKPLITGLSDSVTDLNYILFVNMISQEELLLAEEYINPSSVKTVENISINVAFSNVTTEDLAVIRNAIAELGYTSYTITTR